MAQLTLVEELALLIKDNLPCKHLVLSMEESLVEFLQNNTSPNAILELEPMTSYHRMLLHRLADIFGLAHESVGEGNDRRLILERSPESAIDILWQFDHHQSPVVSHQLLRRKEVLPDYKNRQTASFSPSISVEEREAAYMAARERIFSSHKDDGCEMKETPKPRNVPVVARRMIAHALGRRTYSTSPSTERKMQNNVLGSASMNTVTSNGLQSACIDMEPVQGTAPLHDHSSNLNGGNVSVSAIGSANSEGDVLPNESGKSTIRESSDEEHLGAAKRIFAQALGLSSPKDANNVQFRCSSTIMNQKSGRTRG
ncbi:uncharacterized protein LOC116247942 isoform X2 [Nymphaea colorata]|uniref:uncharacterized protein LOC116247942 isoform X2 n=1 Tax=Nymphaea colorata TaxID=210225 RepID=UPI00214E1BF1|nr:uncharacterized protein LOC116247942 isoform X2 [Nymphaea colorata]